LLINKTPALPGFFIYRMYGQEIAPALPTSMAVVCHGFMDEHDQNELASSGSTWGNAEGSSKVRAVMLRMTELLSHIPVVVSAGSTAITIFWRRLWTG
jgi:hypothetical protein